MIRIVVLLGLLVTLGSGCGVLEDRTNRYMAENKADPLVVPEWYSDRRLRDRFPVPEADQGFVAAEDFVVPSPPEPGLEILIEQFVIKATDSDTWLLASEAPGRIWPALKNYWESLGARVEEVDTGAGRMQVVLPTNSLKASRFLSENDLLSLLDGDTVTLQVLVQQGLKRKSSEIRIAAAPGNNMVIDTQQTVLNSLKGYLDENAESLESYSLVAQNIGGDEKLSMVSGQGQDPYIRVSLDFDRAWFAVGEALNDSRIPVIDLNRSEGVYYVRYASEGEEEDSPGFWSMFKGRDSDRLSDRFNFKVELLQQVDGIHIISLPTNDDSDPQDKLRLLNQILDHLS